MIVKYILSVIITTLIIAIPYYLGKKIYPTERHPLVLFSLGFLWVLITIMIISGVIALLILIYNLISFS
jgi:hypothetical protein